MSTISAVLGFPRIGPNREVKKAVESYWGNKSSAEDLLAVAKSVRKGRWESIASKGVDVIPSGDFTLYDHVLDHAAAFNAIPERYTQSGLGALDIAFAMGRGRQEKDKGIDLHAMEMKKWFDSNYHFVVPEISPSVNFKLNNNKFLDEYKEAKELGITTRPVLLGPISFLVLSKAARDAPAGYKPISALDSLLEVYKQVLSELKQAGVEHVQIDEPILVQDVGETLGAEFKKVYEALAPVSPKITLTTYFGRIGDSVEFLKSLPIYALHIDLDRAAGQLESVVAAIKSTPIILSAGLVSGRNIWKTDLQAAKKSAEYAINELGKDRVVVATSSSLLHTPVTLAAEDRLTAEQKSWFSFAVEKCEEIATLAKALNGEETEVFKQNTADIAARREFERNSDPAVRERLAAVTEKDVNRQAPFPERQAAQRAHLKLPKFPTTTIGSFPQTKEIRLARSKFNKKEISSEEYEKAMKAEIQHAVDFQERVGLDVFVHGEPERNDMVQYFGEQLQGYAFTQNGWVQSYGSRYVRPPILVSDISRPKAMTVEWSSYAQSLTSKPMKGMLTGPITMLCWSFPRADVSRETQAKQLALALRDEVVDLQNAGVSVIQVDEPAIREGLPLRKGDWGSYLDWAVGSFKLATCGVKNDTQIHSHFCYSDFDDIFPSIKALDADVISIEASKADLKLIDTFKSYSYQNDIGPGVYDIHSPRIPGTEEIKARLKQYIDSLPQSTDLVVNPDCGLKTRGWAETEASLLNVVAAAKWARETYA